MNRMSNPTPYQDVNNVLVQLTEGLQKLLGDKLVGVYLFGSLSYGDFNPESSDIDLVIILKSQASAAELESIEKLHQDIEKQHPKWAKRIESSYTPQYMLLNILPPKEPRPYYGEIFYRKADYGNEWIINLYLLYNYGITLVGPDFKELIKPVNIKDVQEACVRDLFKEWEPKLREPKWLDNSHYQSYLIMNLCRILNTVWNGTVLSKRESSAWVKQQFLEWKDLIETAEKWHYGVEMKRKDEALDFLRFVIRLIKNKQ